MEDQTVKNPDKGGVQSVARIFELIEVLAAHPAGASLQRLAEDAHLAKSTTHRLLGSLVSLGYAAQDGETGKYRLTLKMFEISSGIVNSMDVMSVAKVHLERLAQPTGEAMHRISCTYIKRKAAPCGCPAGWGCAARCTVPVWAKPSWLP